MSLCVSISLVVDLHVSTKFDHKTEQKGIYNRAMITVRIENVEPEKIEAMHQYYMKLKELSNKEEAKFNIILSPV